MWIKNIDGNFVNVETGSLIVNNRGLISVETSQNDTYTVLFDGTNEAAQAYMAELERELAAFGKLIKVEI